MSKLYLPHSETHNKPEKMKAVRWEGKTDSISVKEIDIPKICDPLDAIVRLTSAAICGSDLHIFHKRLETKVPLTLGHENIGIIEEIGDAVTTVKKGDRVIVSDINFKADANGDLEDVALFGYGPFGILSAMDGGQAQYMRVPNAQVNFIVLPSGIGHELDYLLLADIWPTAWWALDAAGQVFGDTVVVFGAGPVGLLCAYSAVLRGATRVYSIDHVPERLTKAKSIGAIPINFTHNDPIPQILELEPDGVDRACDCVGFECVNAKGENIVDLVATQAIKVTKVGGGIGLIGVYTPQDIGAPNPQATKGILSVPIGEFWSKNQAIRSGVIPTHSYRPTQELLMEQIEKKGAKPSFVFDREFNIDDAPEAYRKFAEHKITKAVFRFNKHIKADGVGEEKGGTQI